jgi:hypothetical protein
MTNNKFLDIINSQNYLDGVLRGHLFIESKIVEMIQGKLTNPSVLELDKISFPLKLQLGVALGLLELEDLPAYKKINRLRNETAHKLNFEVTDEKIQDLISNLNPYQLKISNFDDDDDLAFRFRKSIAALYYLLCEKNGEIEISIPDEKILFGYKR